MNSIQDKVVIITGASSGLGEKTALHLASLGAKVVLGARRKDKLDAIVEKIKADGGAALSVETDVTDKDSAANLIQVAVDTFGRVDVMINNAGLMAIAPLEKLKVDEWDRMIDINVKGVLYGIAAALPVFQKQKSGHFINLASVAGLRTWNGGTVYSATKFAVRAITEGLRLELADGTIRNTIISPGAVNSELKGGSSDPESSKAVHEFYESAIPTETVAHAIAYAMSQPDEVDINEIVLRPSTQEF